MPALRQALVRSALPTPSARGRSVGSAHVTGCKRARLAMGVPARPSAASRAPPWRSTISAPTTRSAALLRRVFPSGRGCLHRVSVRRCVCRTRTARVRYRAGWAFSIASETNVSSGVAAPLGQLAPRQVCVATPFHPAWAIAHHDPRPTEAVNHAVGNEAKAWQTQRYARSFHGSRRERSRAPLTDHRARFDRALSYEQ